MKLLTFRLLCYGFFWLISGELLLQAGSSPFTKSISIPYATPESNAPSVLVQYPTNNQQVSESSIQALVAASDDTRVESFRFTVNGTQGDWVWAPGLQWPWGASMALNPGVNTFEVLCADYWGNMTNVSVTFEYVPNSGFALQIGNGGQVTPNYQGQTLKVGQSYSMTAHPAKGFRFAGWSGGLVNSRPKLTFVMQPNLSLSARFKDIKRPLDIITFRRSKALKSAVVIATGKAADNSAVMNVYYRLNDSAWQSAITTNAWRNWETDVLSPVPGKNLLQSYAVDDSGLASRTNRVKFNY
jgi:hypothetical protein